MSSCKFRISKVIFRSLVGGLALLFLGHSTVFAAAGRIQFAAGEAKIVNNKQVERGAKKGV